MRFLNLTSNLWASVSAEDIYHKDKSKWYESRRKHCQVIFFNIKSNVFIIYKKVLPKKTSVHVVIIIF